MKIARRNRIFPRGGGGGGGRGGERFFESFEIYSPGGIKILARVVKIMNFISQVNCFWWQVSDWLIGWMFFSYLNSR